jgi:hypothetical protein
VEQDLKLYYAGLLLLKKMDLKPEDGGMTFPVLLPPELEPLDDVLQELVNQDLIVINPKKHRYDLTKKGLDYLGEHIDEAEALVDEFDDLEMEEAVAAMRERNLDVFRARFLWGWYDGEIDDLVLFQQRRGITPVEKLWAFYLVGDAFWETLEADIRE